jgi:RNA polymerase sigma-70 factor (ECF subfamily)
VWAFAARRVGSSAAEDVTAETFLIAWRKLDSLPSEPLPWLYKVARNVLLRRNVTDAREHHTRTALALQRPADAAAEHDAGLWGAWTSLSAGDREVLALIAWEELRVRDAARVLGIAPAVFSVRLYRARRRLERLLVEPAMPVIISTRSEETS